MKNIPTPPKWANYFLQWFVDEDLIEEIQGDLHEAYYHRATTEGLRKAKWLFVEDVFRFFRPYAFEKYSNAKQFMPMFSNYFKIAFRNILHRKQFTAINLLGLSIGISAVLLIGLYLQNEWSYDQSAPNYERIYRLANSYRDQVYAPMSFGRYNSSNRAEQLKLTNHLQEYESVETAGHFVISGTAVSGTDQYYVRVNDREYIQQKIVFTNTGTSFLELFPQTFLTGNATANFADYPQVLLTEEMAERYFGDNWQQQEVVGKPYIFEDQTYLISGVVKNSRTNNHFNFDVILSQDSLNAWGGYTYLKTTENGQIDQILTQLNQDIDQVYPGYTEDELSKGVQAIPLTEIHFTPDLLYEIKPVANKAYLNAFGLIALVILLIIWTNYTNLSIAMYADRQKELGMRKVLGARGQDISFQLIIEAVILTLICLPIAWLLLQFSLPVINDKLGWELDLGLLYSLPTFFTLFGILVLTGIFSGLYPALVYGQKSMVNLFSATLSGKPGQRLFNFRNSLIMVQFILLVSLLSTTWFIHQQMNYVSTKNLGFEKEGVLFFDLYGAEKYNQLKPELLKISGIKAVGTGMIPGNEMYNQLTYKMKGGEETFTDGTNIYTDVEVFDVLGIPCTLCADLKKGKERAFVINQTAADKLAKSLGINPEELVGQTLISEPEYENERYGFGIPYTIGGIIEDYDYFSLKHTAQPLLISISATPTYSYNVILKADSNDWPKTIAQIEQAYKTVETEQPFDFNFMSDHLNKLYLAEKQAGYFMSGLSLVAVILALMGLAGIVSYITFNRQKEISIRKVFGASNRDILWIMNKDFFILMGIAILIAAPIAIFLTKTWLSSFAYRISVNPLIVILAGLVALLLVISVVSIQSRRTVEINPIDSLKHY